MRSRNVPPLSHETLPAQCAESHPPLENVVREGSVVQCQKKDSVRALIDEALYRWRRKGMHAENISVVITFLSEEASGERETLSISCRNQTADREGEERVAVKRAREEVKSVPPPQKRTRLWIRE